LSTVFMLPQILVSFHSYALFTNDSNLILFSGMYDYIPTILNNQSWKSCENYDANFAFIVKTKETISILKWLVLCALEMGCMAPPGSQLNCDFNGDRYTRDQPRDRSWTIKAATLLDDFFPGEDVWNGPHGY
uniref:G_PROTEIN_RECEP_F2_3 domain-containing protein n=1 Tax=Haemonchus placei TaxID=6290 RepID=A0A0N4WZA0_HAEPC